MARRKGTKRKTGAKRKTGTKRKADSDAEKSPPFKTTKLDQDAPEAPTAKLDEDEPEAPTTNLDQDDQEVPETAIEPPLLRLPQELRDHIILQLLPSEVHLRRPRVYTLDALAEGNEDLREHPVIWDAGDSGRALQALLGVNRQLRQDTLDVVAHHVENTTFIFDNRVPEVQRIEAPDSLERDILPEFIRRNISRIRQILPVIMITESRVDTGEFDLVGEFTLEIRRGAGDDAAAWSLVSHGWYSIREPEDPTLRADYTDGVQALANFASQEVTNQIPATPLTDTMLNNIYELIRWNTMRNIPHPTGTHEGWKLSTSEYACRTWFGVTGRKYVDTYTDDRVAARLKRDKDQREAFEKKKKKKKRVTSRRQKRGGRGGDEPEGHGDSAATGA